MSDDAKCVLELFEIHLEMLEELITDKNVPVMNNIAPMSIIIIFIYIV